VAYKNDIEGFIRHHMQPLSAWMAFHLTWWFIWMIIPHLIGLLLSEREMLKLAFLTWSVFLLIWLSSWFLGKIVYIPIEIPPWCV